MLSTNPIHTTKPEFIHSIPLVSQHASQGESPTIFTDIYQEDVNIAIWKRNLPSETQGSVKKFLALNPKFQSEMIVTPQNIFYMSKKNNYIDMFIIQQYHFVSII